ncbi:MAG TPA: MliC family protein [Vitreimonas sp.]|uniref:MliC family protein n=1 Tax=Vitreimonas sp. TaxID=3069702 RepID=UPI002D3B8C3D|nr:MliC family protein [Vitreimonas sp.]HYD86352.1 MliC family protein [Vitreimonas sp.]
MNKLLILAALAALAACGTTQRAGGPRADWRCDGGAAFSVRFNDNAAEVFAGGQVYTLPAAQSGSGARYSNGTVEYWEHQGEATLNGAAGGPYTNCRSN